VTLEELLIRESARETLGVYARAVDRGQFDEVVETFTDDALLEVPPSGSYCGHAQIRTFMVDLRKRFERHIDATGKPFYLRHHLTTSRINVQSDRSATAWTRFLALGPQGIDHTGTYTDRLMPVGDHLRLVRRKIVIDWYATDSPVPAMMRASP
jgi:hypothetical protein